MSISDTTSPREGLTRVIINSDRYSITKDRVHRSARTWQLADYEAVPVGATDPQPRFRTARPILFKIGSDLSFARRERWPGAGVAQSRRCRSRAPALLCVPAGQRAKSPPLGGL